MKRPLQLDLSDQRGFDLDSSHSLRQKSSNAQIQLKPFLSLRPKPIIKMINPCDSNEASLFALNFSILQDIPTTCTSRHCNRKIKIYDYQKLRTVARNLLYEKQEATAIEQIFGIKTNIKHLKTLLVKLKLKCLILNNLYMSFNNCLDSPIT